MSESGERLYVSQYHRAFLNTRKLKYLVIINTYHHIRIYNTNDRCKMDASIIDDLNFIQEKCCLWKISIICNLQLKHESSPIKRVTYFGTRYMSWNPAFLLMTNYVKLKLWLAFILLYFYLCGWELEFWVSGSNLKLAIGQWQRNIGQPPCQRDKPHL